MLVDTLNLEVETLADPLDLDMLPRLSNPEMFLVYLD